MGFFHKLQQGDIFVALDSVQFQKNGLQNRNKVKNQQGWQWLTVPVSQHLGQLINQVNLNSNVPWQRKHWNTLVSNYSRAPYFDKYAPGLEKLLAKQWTNLCELDMALIKWVMDALGINTPIVYSSALDVGGNKTELLINICQALGADAYLSGSGGKRYMDLTAFEAAGIDVIWQEFSFPSYVQVFPDLGFVSELSVIDTLFCCGPETSNFLEQVKL
jgi:WbqC-like protein family